MFSLVTLAALMAMAFLGASSAMAESTSLCSNDSKSSCTEITHVHETSVGKGKLKSSLPTIECTVLFLGDTVEGSSTPLVIEGNFTYTSCNNFCSVKEESPNATIEVLKTASELAAVTGEGLVHVSCPFINCNYVGEGLEGHGLGALTSSSANGNVVITEQNIEAESGSCPEEAFLTLTTTPLSATYIGGGGGGCKKAPAAITEAATFITGHAADLNGTVNPQGCETSYAFEYGTTKEYGSSTGGFAGEGTSNEPETNPVAGLQPNTTYHFRISATNSSGTAHGADETFTTPSESPSATTEAATSLTDTGAVLNGTINPNGAETFYDFEYGTSKSYGNTTEIGGVGSGGSNKKVNKSITGLEPETTYHFRVVAENINGPTAGGDKTFTTKSPTWATQSTPNPSGAKSSRLTFASCTLSTACTSVGEYVNSGSTMVPLASGGMGKNGRHRRHRVRRKPAGANCSAFHARPVLHAPPRASTKKARPPRAR